MEKKFFEAFPNLKLEGVHKDFFEQVAVEKITATKRKDLLRIYIRSAVSYTHLRAHETGT